MPFGLTRLCRRAISPTRMPSFSVYATTLGVVLLPSALAMTTACPPSKMLKTELVVPRSIPTIDDMVIILRENGNGLGSVKELAAI